MGQDRQTELQGVGNVSLPKNITFATDPEIMKKQFQDILDKARAIEVQRDEYEAAANGAAALERAIRDKEKLFGMKFADIAPPRPREFEKTDSIIAVYKPGLLGNQFVYAERTPFEEQSGYVAAVVGWAKSTIDRAFEFAASLGDGAFPEFSPWNYLEVAVKVCKGEKPAEPEPEPEA